jgi:branched-chain amino acid transport system substrate-binding protein
VRFPRRVTASLLTSALLVTGLAGCTKDDTSSGGTGTFVIGADLDNSSPVDLAYARALQLRIDEVNASGQLGKRKLALRPRENHSDPASTLRDVTALADDSTVVAMVAGECDECDAQAAKTIDDRQLPTIALAPSDAMVTPVAAHRFTFKLGPNSVDSAATMVGELNRVKFKSAGVIYADDLYGQGAYTAIKNELVKNGIDAQEYRSVKPTATDVSQEVTAVTAGKPAALLVFAAPQQAALTANAAKAAGFHGKIYFDAAAAGDQFIASSAEAATDNATMVFTQILAIDDVIATTPAKAARKQWFRDYTARYGTYSGVAAFAADAVSLIADAVVTAGGDRGRIRDILETSQLDGLSGPIRFTPDNHSGLMPQSLTLLVARTGRWRLES